MNITPQRVTAENFMRFGAVAKLPTNAEPLAAEASFSYWSDVAAFAIEGPTEIGYCTVFRQEGGPINWLERHVRTPELLIPIDAPFFLPVMRDDESVERLEVFEVRPGEAVVIGQGVWHGACHPTHGEEATYFVIFRRGTPAEDVAKRELQDLAISQR